MIPPEGGDEDELLLLTAALVDAGEHLAVQPAVAPQARAVLSSSLAALTLLRALAVVFPVAADCCWLLPLAGGLRLWGVLQSKQGSWPLRPLQCSLSLLSAQLPN